jgi:antitoxin PrlF
MTHKVGAKGQVVIPKELRDEVGLSPGDEVSFALKGGTVLVAPVRSTRPLRARFAGSGLTTVLEAERRRDRGREDRS